jgi:DNA-binding response OmpR family regulator
MARILVIDDDEILNDMMVQLLTESGYEVEGARDGDRGLQLFNSNAYDLIITDIVMPEKEGIETIFGVRAKNKHVPIIAVSGGGKLGPEHYLPMAMQCGANYTFEKPFNNSEFLEAVRKCLAGTA